MAEIATWLHQLWVMFSFPSVYSFSVGSYIDFFHNFFLFFISFSFVFIGKDFFIFILSNENMPSNENFFKNYFILFIYVYFKLQFTFNIILYYFPVYSIVVRELYNLWSDTPNNSTTHLAPYVVITILSTILPILYSASPNCLVTTNVYFLILQFFHPAPQALSHLATISLVSVSMSLFLFCLFISFVL